MVQLPSTEAVRPAGRPRREETRHMHASTPHNPVTRTVYSGGNREILQLEQRRQGYSSSRWYTYCNALKIGRPVLRGETGTEIQNPFGRSLWVFNEDQLVSGGSFRRASPAYVNLETDHCVESSIVPQNVRFSRRQPQSNDPVLRLVRRCLAPC